MKIIIKLPYVILSVIEILLISSINISIQTIKLIKLILMVLDYILYLRITRLLLKLITRVNDKELLCQAENYQTQINFKYLNFRDKILSFYALNIIIISSLFVKSNCLVPLTNLTVNKL